MIRIIPRLDIKNGILIKGINLEGLRVLGDPYEYAQHYYKNFADEIYYVDNVASLYGTNNLSDFVKRTSKNLFIPLTVGGGIRTIKDIEKMLTSGADKVSINTAAIENPQFIKEASKKFGSSNISVAVEVIKIKEEYYISKCCGRDLIKIDPIEWCKTSEDLGVGEIILTSVNSEGLMHGFDVKLIRKVSKNLSVPLIIHGGCGSYNDVLEVIKNNKNISGVSIASFLHYDYLNVSKIKKTKIGNCSFLTNYKKKREKFKNHLINLKKFLKKNNVEVRI